MKLYRHTRSPKSTEAVCNEKSLCTAMDCDRLKMMIAALYCCPVEKEAK